MGDRGVLIIGPSGSGKSALALQLIALGADLVADDRTRVVREGDNVIAQAPETISGLIEARGVGILRLPSAGPTPLALVVDMSHTEEERLPPQRTAFVHGRELPCLHRVEGPQFAPAILLYLRCSINSAP
ncbi:HPr kinase/phosphorylase [Sulfitobacter sp. THAF37]|uniref:HPr kinase/phosphorylase n=1 Tax=Sulfitobacter sp. THAF37 TaxID=2587855 RepID=UPI0012A96E4F|nr:HPr kinase/phosphorylase [Sulfitobacter sp. THAF37]